MGGEIVANIKSAKKRILVINARTERNKAVRSKVKTYVKKVYQNIEKSIDWQLWVFTISL